MNTKELKRLAEPLASPNGSDSNASWWDAFHRAANPAAILALIQQRDELLAELKHIREYWNGDQNDEAMADACFAAINISEAAIAKCEAQS